MEQLLKQKSRQESGQDPIDYSFSEGGINYQRRLFGADGSIVSSDGNAKVISSDTNPGINSYAHELSDEAARVITNHESDRESVEYFVLNQKVPSENGVIIYNMGFGGDARHPVARREAELVASENPARQVIVINNAGSGDSSAPPKQVLSEMKETGSYIPQATWIYDMLGNELDKYGDNIEIWGHSMGAQLAIGLAAAHFAAKGEQVSGLRLIDPPGSEHKGLFGMMVGFVIKEGAKTAEYAQSPYNETEKLPTHDGQPKLNRTWIERFTALKRLFIDQPIVMGGEGLKGDLEQALPAVRDNLAIVSPEHSDLTKAKDVSGILGRLATKAVRPETIQQIVLPNHSHSIISAGAGARPGATIYGLAGSESLEINKKEGE